MVLTAASTNYLSRCEPRCNLKYRSSCIHQCTLLCRHKRHAQQVVFARRPIFLEPISDAHHRMLECGLCNRTYSSRRLPWPLALCHRMLSSSSTTSRPRRRTSKWQKTIQRLVRGASLTILAYITTEYHYCTSQIRILEQCCDCSTRAPSTDITTSQLLRSARLLDGPAV